MQTKMFDLVRKIGVFTVCTSDVPETKEELIKKMSNAGMISVGEYDVSSFNCQMIIDEIEKYMYEKFTDNEICAYFLKYYFKMDNEKIHKQTVWIGNIPFICTKINIRRIERIHMSIKRRKWCQPKYTNHDFKTIDDIVGDEKFKSAVRVLGVGPLSIEEFKWYCLDRYLSRDHIKDISHSSEYNIVQKAVSELVPELEFVDITEFPWNMLYFLEGDNNGVSVYTMMKNYMNKHDITYAELVDNVDVLIKVIKYNISAFINHQNKMDVTFERFIERKSFMNINVPTGISNEYLSTARVQQLFESGLIKICNAMHDGRFLFDGFELLVRHYSKPDQYAEAIIENVTSVLPLFSADVHRVLQGIIPTFDTYTLREMVDAVYENPLILNILEYGFDKGLVVTNKELRVQHGMTEVPLLPKDIFDVGLSYRTSMALVRAGYKTSNDLVCATYHDISSIRGIGKKCIQEIVHVLNMYGHTLTGIPDDMKGNVR